MPSGYCVLIDCVNVVCPRWILLSMGASNKDIIFLLFHRYRFGRFLSDFVYKIFAVFSTMSIDSISRTVCVCVCVCVCVFG